MNNLRFLLPLFLLPFFNSAQNNITISGYVDEIESGEKLIGATIYDLSAGKESKEVILV